MAASLSPIEGQKEAPIQYRSKKKPPMSLINIEKSFKNIAFSWTQSNFIKFMLYIIIMLTIEGRPVLNTIIKLITFYN